MSFAAQGVYFRLLCHMWSDSKNYCSIEKNSAGIARLLGVTEPESNQLLTEIQHEGDPLFQERGGKYISKRLKSVRAQQVAYRKAKSDAGKKGMESRYQKDNTVITPPLTEGITKSNLSSSPPSPSSLLPAADSKPFHKKKNKPSPNPGQSFENAFNGELTDQTQEIIDHWNKVWSMNIVVTTFRKDRVGEMLGWKFSVEQIKIAVENLQKSDFHAGRKKDEGFKAPGPEWFDTHERLEAWVQWKAPPTSAEIQKKKDEALNRRTLESIERSKARHGH